MVQNHPEPPDRRAQAGLTPHLDELADREALIVEHELIHTPIPTTNLSAISGEAQPLVNELPAERSGGSKCLMPPTF